MALHTYSPKSVSVIVAGTPLSCFSEDSVVTIAYNSDAWTPVVGADGCEGRSYNPDRSGTLTVSLLSISDSNDYLSALAIADANTLLGTFPAMVKDENGTTLAVSYEAYIMQVPERELAREIGTSEWQIRMPNMQYFHGGNA